jgi:hypothetical protein
VNVTKSKPTNVYILGNHVEEKVLVTQNASNGVSIMEMSAAEAKYSEI